MWCKDKKLDVLAMYCPEVGAFGKIGTCHWDSHKRLRVLCWYGCREDFYNGTMDPYFDEQGKADRRTFLYAVEKSSRALDVAAFINKFEERLGLTPETKFGPTYRNNVIWYRPAAWWLKSQARRSLFTGLMRSAMYYDQKRDNFNRTLDYRTYTRRTRKAIDYFMAGHTTYTGNSFDGWQSTFEFRSDDEIKKMLVKPKDKLNVARK